MICHSEFGMQSLIGVGLLMTLKSNHNEEYHRISSAIDALTKGELAFKQLE